MIDFINHLSQNWYEFYYWSIIQNSLFLTVILGLLYFLRKTNVLLLKLLTVAGLAKLLIPPIFEFKITEPVPIPFISTMPPQNIIVSSQSIPNNIALSSESLLLVIWLITVIIIFGYILGQYVKMIRSIKNAYPLDITDMETSLNPDRIRFYKAKNSISPFVIGFFNYKVVLPIDWDNWSVNRKRMVINHELLHIKQKDPWINLLKVTVFAFNFFNPLIWIMINRLNHYTELVCDYMTMESVDITNKDYSLELVKISDGQRIDQSLSPTTLAFSESFERIKQRISHHLTVKEGSKMKFTRNSFMFYLFLCCLLMVSFLWRCETDQTIKSNSIESEDIYGMKEVSEMPEMLTYQEPVYPQAAIDQEIEGIVRVDVVINETGEVIDAGVNEQASVPLLNAAAVEASKKCIYKPAMQDSVPVKVKTSVSFHFNLDFADPEVAKAKNLYRFYDVPVKPIITHKETPLYPEEARKKGISGFVLLTITINEKGNIEQARVYNKDADPLLAKAALEAVYKCKFKPAQIDGKPVKVNMNIPYRFALE